MDRKGKSEDYVAETPELASKVDDTGIKNMVDANNASRIRYSTQTKVPASFGVESRNPKNSNEKRIQQESRPFIRNTARPDAKSVTSKKRATNTDETNVSKASKRSSGLSISSEKQKHGGSSSDNYKYAKAKDHESRNKSRDTSSAEIESPLWHTTVDKKSPTAEQTSHYRSAASYSQKSPRSKSSFADVIEDASFMLSTNSFDISETGNYLRDFEHQYDYGLAPPSPGTHENHHLLNTKIDIALLPDLNREDSVCSLGDISPIKIAHGQGDEDVVVVGDFPPLELQFSRRDGLSRKNQKQGAGISDISSHPHRDDTNYQQGQYNRRAHVESQISNPLYVLRSCYKAFAGCTYLLPFLREIEPCQVNVSSYGSIQQRREHQTRPDRNDLLIATRRVETAICTFGGILKPTRSVQKSSIFRLKGSDQSRSKHLYAQNLPNRYHLSGSHISWDAEEDPSVEIHIDNEEGNDKRAEESNKRPHIILDDAPHQGNNIKMSDEACAPSPASSSSPGKEPKMKYRCKLCGQLKNNHKCTWKQSLQRSIGVMVFPAANSYTADEPGLLAPTLSKMNNFVSYEPGQYVPEDAHSRSEYRYQNSSHFGPNQVTPQSLREGGLMHSPQSTLPKHSTEASPQIQSSSAASNEKHETSNRLNKDNRKRYHSQLTPDSANSATQAPFVASITLRPEQYRSVTPSKVDGTSSTAFQYPAIPLTFSERKRLSDTLFYLSKEMVGMTNECASVLHDAREKDEWDLAVAELLTQIVVALYCGEGDFRLIGLQEYLMKLGVSC